MANKWRVKKGNKSVQDIPVYDKDDVLLTNLAAATEIKFVVKASKTASTALFTKALTDGIVVDTPSAGYLRITLLPADTEQVVDYYYMALQIKWSANDVYECRIYVSDMETDTFEVEQDIVT